LRSTPTSGSWPWKTPQAGTSWTIGWRRDDPPAAQTTGILKLTTC
jgi:hypothetical protein